MKKALVILMALAMVFAVYADDLAAVTLKGEASLGYSIKLDDSSFGMTNGSSSSQEFTVTIVTKDREKATSGSGVWGELVVKSTEAKITQGGLSGSGVATLATAKIHFSDVLAINVLAPGLGLASNGPAFITGDFSAATTAVAANAAFTNGFTAEVRTDIVDINVQVADNGVKVAEQKKLAVVADATIKAIDNISIWGGVGYNGDLNKGVAFAGKVAFKADALSVTAAFNQDYAKAQSFAAGAVYAFDGSAGPVDYMTAAHDGVCDSGISVAVKTGDFKAFGLGAAVFKNAIIDGLTAGAEILIDDAANFAKGTGDKVIAGVNYGTKFGDFDFAADFGFKMLLASSDFGVKYGASISTDAFIQNVTLKAAYAGSQDAKVGGADTKGTIDLTAKIHF